MIAYVEGKLAQKDAAYAIIDAMGVGYEVRISLQTFSALPAPGEKCRVYTYLNIREDAHVLFGFAEPDEKKLFLDLVGVSGVGPATALVMLSSLSSSEIRHAIMNEDLRVVQSIKGIGLKTAQRVILELKDKMRKDSLTSPVSFLSGASSGGQARGEALAALITLGIPKPAAEKSLDTIIKREGEGLTVEQLIKLALR
ncbi:Holliday junction branch migration protein RuvA [Arundinibacter roseus]|uniref:Holliday junction branch migration complex subunit RuvA n=1 Tax=Arundinibacter roseus TaxID=2070510 RepID=A0A4R4KD40_9BACT|nr:Holliday junction branch migration protein RuvA [Arundinibacter roseus]TDB65804.1 Holliday junction branch migration protein RuvA [Arundinibacter roseus]